MNAGAVLAVSGVPVRIRPIGASLRFGREGTGSLRGGRRGQIGRFALAWPGSLSHICSTREVK
jgi:hypothetical protein